MIKSTHHQNRVHSDRYKLVNDILKISLQKQLQLELHLLPNTQNCSAYQTSPCSLKQASFIMDSVQCLFSQIFFTTIRKVCKNLGFLKELLSSYSTKPLTCISPLSVPLPLIASDSLITRTVLNTLLTSPKIILKHPWIYSIIRTGKRWITWSREGWGIQLRLNTTDSETCQNACELCPE